MNPITRFFKKHIKTLYYFVPPCPLCKSTVTGRFVKLRRDTVSEWQIEEALKFGELIKPVQELGRNNCYCLSCGCQWPDDVKTQFLSLEEIEYQKDIRLTRLMLNKIVEEEREAIKKDHGMFKSVRRFIGKI